MTKRETILAALASSPGATYTPVQVQKLLFLVDENIPEEIGGPVFNFTPYDYGPFDSSVYHILEKLEVDSLALIDGSKGSRGRTYRLSVEGQRKGTSLLEQLNPATAAYIRQLSEYVLRLSFTELVSAIYKAYPRMRARSVFRD